MYEVGNIGISASLWNVVITQWQWYIIHHKPKRCAISVKYFALCKNVLNLLSNMHRILFNIPGVSVQHPWFIYNAHSVANWSKILINKNRQYTLKLCCKISAIFSYLEVLNIRWTNTLIVTVRVLSAVYQWISTWWKSWHLGPVMFLTHLPLVPHIFISEAGQSWFKRL